ncbi:MAG TPA: hypothetical protein GXZ82_13695 [Firmicutes bacterium]|jgi:uncharacterized membrane protein (Fun14 family)|nr:hypothetical protein [Bacillota bacterium]
MSQANPTTPLPDFNAFDWTGLGKQLGLGAILGFALGYLAKKAMKAVLLFVGLLLLLLVALETQGLITINWPALEDGYNRAVAADTLGSTFNSISAYIGRVLPSAAGFVLGFMLGFRKG